MGRCLLICTFLAFSTTGCFVIEELDQGMKLLEVHWSSDESAKEREEAEEAERYVPAKVDPDFWKNARTITPGSASSSGMVSCNLRGQVQFMKRDDCVNRGGKLE